MHALPHLSLYGCACRQLQDGIQIVLLCVRTAPGRHSNSAPFLPSLSCTTANSLTRNSLHGAPGIFSGVLTLLTLETWGLALHAGYAYLPPFSKMKSSLWRLPSNCGGLREERSPFSLPAAFLLFPLCLWERWRTVKWAAETEFGTTTPVNFTASWGSFSWTKRMKLHPSACHV